MSPWRDPPSNVVRRERTISILISAGALLAASCGNGGGDDTADTLTSTSPAPSTTTPQAPPTTSGDDIAATVTSSPAPSTIASTVPPTSTGEDSGPACRYTNPFTGEEECRRYVGEGWSDADRETDCAAPFSSTEGALVFDGCPLDASVGTCRIGTGEPEETLTVYYGGDTGLLSQFCANPGGGLWLDAGESAPPATPAIGDVQPDAADAMVSTDAVAVDPECTDESCLASLVEERRAVEFTPRAQAPKAGLVLFPGASVDARAYAPLAQLIAESGFFVALVPVPGGVSLGHEDRVDDVVAAHPEITTWVVGGHSLGGVAAATYAANDAPERVVSGLVLWASYVDEQAGLPEIGVAVTSIYGSEDGLTTVGDVQENRSFLPDDTRYVEIDGGNHAQFGSYGAQEGDGTALISPELQADLAAEATAHFMAGVASGTLPALDPRYTAARALEASWCAGSQATIADLVSGGPEVSIDELRDEQEFVESKPSVDDAGVVTVPMHRYPIGQHTVLDAPPILTGELWCKHKSQDFFVARGATAAGDPGRCATVNAAAWEWALGELTGAERRAWDATGLEVVFAPDIDHPAGPAWLAGGVDVERDDTTVTVTASRLVVAADADLDDPRNTGLAYCKLWSPAEALRLALGDE